MALNVGTLNLKYDDYPSNGCIVSAWNNRKLHIIAILMQKDFEIFTVQECSEKAFDDLGKSLKQRYNSVWNAHAGKRDGIAIFYKKHVFDRRDTQVIFTSKGCNNGLYVDLADNNKTQYRVVTTHLTGGISRKRGYGQLKEIVKKSDTSDKAIIFAGDFNNEPFDSEKEDRLGFMGENGFRRVSLGEHETLWHSSIRSDHIFLKNIVGNCLEAQTEFLFKEGMLLSNHALVFSKISVDRQASIDYHVEPKNRIINIPVISAAAGIVFTYFVFYLTG